MPLRLPPANSSLPGALLPWILALAYLAGIGYLGQAFHRIEAHEIKRVTELAADGPQPVELSLVRYIAEPPGRVSLELDFAAPAEPTRLAAFFPRMNATAQILVNNQPLHQPPTTFRANYQYQPLWVPIPPSILRPDHNTLRIQLMTHGSIMVLSTFYLGPAQMLEPTWLLFQFFRQQLLLGALVAAGLLALFMGTIWIVRPQLGEFGWLALAFAAFSYYLFSFVGVRQPLLGPVYDWSFLLARAVFVWSFVGFVHRFLAMERRWLEWALGLFYIAIFTVGLGLILGDRYGDFLRLTYVSSMPMVLVVIAYVSVVLMQALLRRHHVYLHWLLVGSLLGLLLGLHDVLVLFDVQHWLVRDFYISHYAIVFISVGYGGVLVHRIARALLNSEDLNAELNRLLDLKTRELEQASAQRAQSERELALSAQRQRIMADMHDGVGGQLVGLIAAHRGGRLDRAALGAELDAILADLRLVLDALTPAGEDLVLALARLTERYQRVLQSAGLTLHWSVDRTISTVPLPPEHTVNVLRLVQEAVQNVVKHAGAANIWLTLAKDSDGYLLSVADDGKGMAADHAAGHGTATMARRADAVGAVLRREARPEGGTRVSLSLPPA